MIEQGLIALVNANAGVQAIVAGGGFLGSLPKDAALPNWSYIRISGKNHTALQSPYGLQEMVVEINCYGTGAQIVTLANAINAVLNGYRGVLSDPDSTYVDSCLLEAPPVDSEEDPAARTFRRRMEYRVFFGTTN